MTTSSEEPTTAADPTTTGTSWVTHVERAVEALVRGGMVLVVDHEDRENEGDLLLAAETATAEQVAFVVRHTTGILCAPMTEDHADLLGLPPMVAQNTDSHETAFTITVDHRSAGTGVSARDRARTFRALADTSTSASDLRRPGHVFPLRARAGGVLERSGHTEAAVDLLELAGRTPVGLIGEVVSGDGSMMRTGELRRFAARHGIPLTSVADLVRYRDPEFRHVRRVSSAAMPTAFGNFEAAVFQSYSDDAEHLVLTMGDLAGPGAEEGGVLVRIHSECLTGDIIGSLRCDCGTQLEQSMIAIAQAGAGVVVYLRGHEGRGIGLGPKIHAYSLQETGLDTVDANTAQGLPVDARRYDSAAHILRQLGVQRVRLITNNSDKLAALVRHGLTVVERVALPAFETVHNRRYLRTKRERMGQTIDTGVRGGADTRGNPVQVVVDG
ncbi:3,4-dihydroxy-2-butanone-4-phosphate synthase [Nocardioides sp. 1609]|uniref:3,4-dihydroxy-2-butanone-4-phosphate synthase n=1 Tax=Nocardioides sp. 1609 TaxID=2508327 RepID=UPI00106F3130|nr:3,4-dihydroxy-2-butanone-4-phosphate synthase [Nocardioides sp. 1609]